MKTFKQFLLEIHGLDNYVSQEGKPHPDLKFNTTSADGFNHTKYHNDKHNVETSFYNPPGSNSISIAFWNKGKYDPDHLTPQDRRNTDPQKVLEILVGQFRHHHDNNPKKGEPGFKPYSWAALDTKTHNMIIQVLDYIGAPHTGTSRKDDDTPIFTGDVDEP